MRFVLFYHSFVSCWNHGNAHFLRGIARELIRRGHEVIVYEPADGWSRTNALADDGASALSEAAMLVPGVVVRQYDPVQLELDAALDGADVVIVHEWTAVDLVGRIGRARRKRHFALLFHDTHHRAVTKPHEIDSLPLEDFDGILAFGEVLRRVYERRGWGRRAFTWHEAADVPLFRPIPGSPDVDLVWIGNWGDDERTQELSRYLLTPVENTGIRGRVFGVRYPAQVQKQLHALGFEYGGWLPNHRAPAAYARARLTIHILRGPYVEALPGIPTIRVFEALACGVPLICSPWRDEEKLFPAASYLSVRTADETVAAIRLLLRDRELADQCSRRGLAAIRSSHTCAHRVDELFDILNVFCAPASSRASPSVQQDMLLS